MRGGSRGVQMRGSSTGFRGAPNERGGSTGSGGLQMRGEFYWLQGGSNERKFYRLWGVFK